MTVSIDADHPKARETAGFFSQIARHLRQNPAPLRVRVAFLREFPHGARRVRKAAVPVTLDLNTAGHPAVRAGDERAPVGGASDWILDLPLPFALPATLVFAPAKNGRFRVRAGR